MSINTTNGIHGRGSASNPPNRFIPLYREAIPGWTEEGDPTPRTRFFDDTPKTILNRNDSPDIWFDRSLNPYRGCEHGCIYCYARPTHEYLGLSSGLDFESQIFVKRNAPELLRRELSSPKWEPQVVSISGVTDAYQPIERRLELTRRCLEVFHEFGNPISIVTKNSLVARDRDILGAMAARRTAGVYVSVTTLDDELSGLMEPRASRPAARLRAIEELTQAGVPVGVLMGPVIPGLNDHEVAAILTAAKDAGASRAGYVMLRLPYQIKDLFAEWLEHHFPAKKERVMGRIRSIRGGDLNDSRFGSRMRGEGESADLFAAMFRLARDRAGLTGERSELTTEHFRLPGPRQGTLFD